MRPLALTCALALAACGPALQGKEPKLPAAKPEAVEALKEAARAVRLGPASYDRALERLKIALELDPKLWEAHYDQGWLLLKLKRPEEAVAPLEKALSILPSSAATVELLADAYLQTGKPGDAAKSLRAFLDRPAQDPGSEEEQARRVRLRVALGGALRRAGKLDDATEALRQALRLAPKAELPAALNQLGLVYLAKDQLELAELVLRRALEVDDKSRAAADLWNNLGLVQLRRRRDQEAFAAFDQAARLDPQLTVARRNKALVYLDCGDYGRAADELRAVTKADPQDLDAWIALGVAERGRGAHDAAARAYDRALELKPDAPDALYDLGILDMDFERKPKRAAERFERFLKVAPSSHPKRKDAETRLKELAQSPSEAPK